MKLAIGLLAGLWLGGCVAHTPPPTLAQSVDQIRAERAVADEAKSRSVVRASPKESAASGTKTCTITNMGRAMVIGVAVRGERRWTLAMVGEEYPLSNTYLRMDGKRYTGREDRGIVLTPAMIEVLKRDPELDLAWTNWPYGTSEEHKATLTGFADAFAECDAFLKAPAR